MRLRILPLLFFFSAAFLACHFEKSRPIPDELIGVWRTSSPKYADRYLRLTKDRIIFGTGGQSSESFRIVKVKEVASWKHVLYTISYLNQEDQEYNFSFFYDPERKNSIQLKNQIGIIWRREEAKS